eukprot:scaffold11_cov257-Pinguiococcus_pyrenoidosus.AAC.42
MAYRHRRKVDADTGLVSRRDAEVTKLSCSDLGEPADGHSGSPPVRCGPLPGALFSMRASSAKLKVLRGGKIAKLHVQRTMRPMFPANSEPPNEFASTSSPRTTGTSPSRDGSQLSDAAGRPATSEVKWGAHEPIARGGASVAGRKRALPSAKENPFFNFRACEMSLKHGPVRLAVPLTSSFRSLGRKGNGKTT